MDFTTQRTKMVDSQIRTTDVTSHSVLSAFYDVPREKFVPERLQALAYVDSELELAPGRYLMPASPLAKLVQAAELQKTDSVLEIGAATGYATAILSRLAGSVVALESEPSLLEALRANVAGLSNVTVAEGDLKAGHAANGPYDFIFINGSVDEVPEALFAQLKEGGRLITVIGEGLAAGARIFVREHGIQSERFLFNAYVKHLPGFERTPEFVF